MLSTILNSGRVPEIRRKLLFTAAILARGELTKKLTVSAHGFSKAAREAIEGAGGTATVIE